MISVSVNVLQVTACWPFPCIRGPPVGHVNPFALRCISLLGEAVLNGQVVHDMTSGNWMIDSARLRLRPFTAADADEAFAAITPGLTRYMAFGPPPSKEAFAVVWQAWLPTIASGTDITFVIRRRDDGAFLGLAGLHRSRDAEPELGIWISEAMHGQGYGREAVSAVWSRASAHLRCAAFRYPVAEQNAPSRRLVESLGGVPAGREQGVKYTAIVYRIPAAKHGDATGVAESG